MITFYLIQDLFVRFERICVLRWHCFYDRIEEYLENLITIIKIEFEYRLKYLILYYDMSILWITVYLISSNLATL